MAEARALISDWSGHPEAEVVRRIAQAQQEAGQSECADQIEAMAARFMTCFRLSADFDEVAGAIRYDVAPVDASHLFARAVEQDHSA
jgi:hypothetical protein